MTSPLLTTVSPHSYKIGGVPIASMPASLAVLGSVEVEYITLPGWTESLASFKVRGVDFTAAAAVLVDS